MLGTAIGPGELCAVRPGDVDLRAGKIAVAGSLGRFGEGATKTPGRTRIVEVCDIVAPVTAALRAQLKTRQLPGPLFANNNGDFLNYTNWRSRNWKSILLEAGIAYRGPYACRHTYAIRMLQHRYDPVYVARQMGHSSTQMIHRHYARWIVGESAVPAEREIV